MFSTSGSLCTCLPTYTGITAAMSFLLEDADAAQTRGRVQVQVAILPSTGSLSGHATTQPTHRLQAQMAQGLELGTQFSRKILRILLLLEPLEPSY